jgi:hypothetical protein
MKQAYTDTLYSEEEIIAILGNDIKNEILTERLDKEYVPHRVHR